MKKLCTLLLVFCMLLSCIPVSAATSSFSGTESVISEGSISYTASYAGVYKVEATAAVTVTTELGSVATVAAGGEGYVYLIKGMNSISVSNPNATVTFTKLKNNGMDYISQVTIASEPVISGQEDRISTGLNKSLAPGETYTFTYTPSQGLAGLVYPYILFTDGNKGNTIRVSADTGFYADLYPDGHTGDTWCWADADSKDVEIIYVRNGENTITIENLGPKTATIKNINIHSAGELSNHAIWGSQINVANLKPIPALESKFSKIAIDSANATATVSFTQMGTMENKIVTLYLAEYDITTKKLLQLNRNSIDMSLQKMGTTEKYSVSMVGVTGNLKAMLIDENLTPIVTVADAENPVLTAYANIYVAPDGNDRNDGSETAPVKTLQRANELVAKIAPTMTDDIIVHFAGGNYPVTTMMTIDKSVSGKNGYKVIYKGDNPENPPVFNAGTKVTRWTKQENSPIWVAPAENITAARTLYVNDQPASLARSRYLYQASGLYRAVGSSYASDGITVSTTNFPDSFTNPEDIMLCFPILWTLTRMPVDRVIAGNGNMTFAMKQPQWATHTTMGYEHLMLGTARPFFIENALEVLDEPGEFYFDKSAKKMYYYPYQEEDMTTAEVYAGTTEKMLYFGGSSKSSKVSNVELNNLTFKYSALNEISENGIKCNQTDDEWYCPSSSSAYYADRLFAGQITVNYADSITIKNCDFACLGSNGINMDNGVTNAKVTGNMFRDISGTALVVGHFLHTNSLPSGHQRVANVEVANNVIRRVANEYIGCAAMAIYYAKNINVHHNDIKDVPYTGISVGWGWGADVSDCRDIMVMYNRIENVTKKTHDGAHVYTLSRMENTHISNNYLISAGDYRGGIYLDEGTEAVTIENNVVTDSVTMIFARAGVGISGCVAKNNYTDTIEDFCDDTVCSESGTVRVTDGNWPKAALDIMNEAGVQPVYNYLLSKAEHPSFRVLAYKRYPEAVFESDEIADINRWVIAKEYTDFHEISHTYPSVYAGGEVGDTRPGEWLEFTFYVPVAGSYNLILRASDGNTASAPACTAKLDLNGKTIQSAYPIPRTGWDLKEYSIGTYNLEKGNHTFRITVQGMDWMIGGFKFENTNIIIPDASDYDEGVMIDQNTMVGRYQN